MNEDVKPENLRIHSRADELIACLEGEIAKRDETIARLEADNRSKNGSIKAFGEQIAGLQKAVRNRERLVGLRDARILELEAKYLELASLSSRVSVELPIACAAPVSEAKAQGVVMPERETSTPSSKWASAGESDPHGKAYDCERAELSMGEYTDDELANAVFMHDHRSFDIAATMRGEPGSIVLLTAAKDRIRWLSRSLDKALARLNAAPAQQVSVPDEMRSLAQRLREYNQNPHHINPMSEAFHILVADAANALSTACVPKEIAAAITWSEHLLFECGALTSTRAPSVHVYNKTFAAVNEARAMIAAAPAAPAADAWIVDMYRHLQKVTPYRFKKIQDASITDGGDVMYFHKDRFDAALLADMAAHCAAKGVV